MGLPGKELKMKIVEKFWFTLCTGATIGIVVCKPEVGERKAYIGLGSGISEEADVDYIAAHGSPVKLEFLKGIVKCMEVK